MDRKSEESKAKTSQWETPEKKATPPTKKSSPTTNEPESHIEDLTDQFMDQSFILLHPDPKAK
jgi:hypothetical protein